MSLQKAWILAAIYAIGLGLTQASAEVGVTADTIRLGQVCALTGPAQGLGQELKAGATAYFEHINRQGGIHGRKISLLTLDDSYEPEQTIEATKKLIDQEQVFMLFGYVGTPTSTAAMPLTKPDQVPFFAPFTGAEFLRTPVRANVYNVRASYFQETEAQVHQLVDVLGKKNIAVFYQNDSYGRAGLGGVQKALRQRGLDVVATGTYQRNTIEVHAALEAIQKVNPEAVIMIGAYKPCATFIKAAKAANMQTLFLNVSFVGSLPLARELDGEGDGVIVTQVVPLPWDIATPLVAEYHQHLHQYMPGVEPGFGSLEGYLDAKIVVQAMHNAGPTLTRAALTQALDSMTQVDFGGVTVSFSPTDHQGLDAVYLTILQGGRYKQVQSLLEH
jgi:ABC-type branched-subunit amino acid transport system substrate-binding protein